MASIWFTETVWEVPRITHIQVELQGRWPRKASFCCCSVNIWCPSVVSVGYPWLILRIILPSYWQGCNSYNSSWRSCKPKSAVARQAAHKVRKTCKKTKKKKTKVVPGKMS